MKEGNIYKNEQGRFQFERDNHCYWTCGDKMTIYEAETDTWLNGRVEHGRKDYYWTNDEIDIPLRNGLRVRVAEDWR